MKVFISSLIAGMEAMREAARDAVTTLRGRPIMAEDFSATPHSPQVTCLTGLRQADLMLLILGERYGAEQPSGLSATHEEYREAQGRKPVIALVQQGISPEPRQEAFIKEVQKWEGGLFRGAFRTEAELRTEVVRALHDYELATAVGPIDEGALRKRSAQLLSADSRRSGPPAVNIAVAGGPRQQILRPSELEDRTLGDHIHQLALFGGTKVFDQSQGVDREFEGDALVLSQERKDQRILLNQSGEVVIRTALEAIRRGGTAEFGLPVLIEEDVYSGLTSAIALSASILEKIDQTQKLTHLAISVCISGGEYLTWRTLAEHRASPTSVSMGMGEADRKPVQLFIPRAALRLDIARLVEDVLVPLRRRWKGSRP